MSGRLEAPREEAFVTDYSVTSFEDLFPEERPPAIRKDLTEKFKEQFPELESLIHLQLVPEHDEHKISIQKDLFLIKVSEDDQVRKAVIAVARHGQELVDPRPDGLSKHIGGCGIYSTPESENPLKYAIRHSSNLAKIMTKKNYFAGLLTIDLKDLGIDLGEEFEPGLKPGFPGGKATIIATDDPKETDWLHSPALQKITGALFPRVIPDMITGTDVGQGQEILERMDFGSSLFGESRIAGIEEGFSPLSDFIVYSMLEAHAALRQLYGEEIPEINGATVAVQGLGNVGCPTAEAMLEAKAACVYVSEPVLTNECDYTPERKRELGENFDRLKKAYGDRIKLVGIDEIYNMPVQIFCPCSSKEGIITTNVMEQLIRNGVKVILPAANNPCGEEATKVGEMAHQEGVYFPPEVVANFGVVAAGVFEYLLEKAREKQSGLTSEEFIRDKLIPHILENVRRQMRRLHQISQREKIGLYNTAEIAYQEYLEALRVPA